ncbi:MAG: S-layer homology domain-containing protein, partial [Candidatus Ornithomonoglobus sp.]
ILTVKAGVKSGTAVITAKVGSVSAQYSVGISQAERYRNAIKLTGPSEIAYDGDGVTAAYKAEVCDQFGVPYENDHVIWSISDTDGFTISSGGILAVSPGLENGASATITVKSIYSDLVSEQMKVTLVENVPHTMKFTNDLKAVALSTKKDMSLSFAASVVDQNGSPVEDEEYKNIIYSVDVPEVLADYIFIDEKTGLLTLKKVQEEWIEQLVGKTIEITASCGEENIVSASTELTICEEIITSIQVSGPSTITVPEKGTSTAKYTVKAYDQNGDADDNYTKLSWQMLGGLNGVYVSDGTVTVTSYAQSGTAALKVTDTENGASAECSIKIVKKSSDTSASGGAGGGGGGSAGGSGGGGNAGYSAGILPSIPIGITDTGSIIEPGTSEKLTFDDMPKTHWASEAVYSLVEMGIVNGRSEKLFAPTENVTRAEFAAMTVRAFDFKGSGTNPAFDDVDEDDWFFDAVATAVENGIVNGVDEKNFAPDAVITRQDMCVILARALKQAGIDLNSDEDTVFSDIDSVSDYAQDAVAAMSSEKILNGYEDGSFRPQGSANRAEAAKVIYESVSKKQ